MNRRLAMGVVGVLLAISPLIAEGQGKKKAPAKKGHSTQEEVQNSPEADATPKMRAGKKKGKTRAPAKKKAVE